MRKNILKGLALLLLAGLLQAHTLFLKLETYFLAPHTEATVALVNGSFDKSENTITRDRMLDVSIAGPTDETVHPDTSQWRDKGTRTYLDFKTGDPGTYVIGVSTVKRMIDLAAADFNEYLEHDGILNVLDARKDSNELGEDVRERYAKHVKAIVQVGDVHTDAYSRRLGYPAEIIPLQNPYTLGAGDTLGVRILIDGEPAPYQLVYASYEGYHDHDADGDHHMAVETEADHEGIAYLKLEAGGRWFVKIIHMEKVAEEGADYESKWATLTFEIK